jgi:SOS-response transcriptional repressor LexA
MPDIIRAVFAPSQAPRIVSFARASGVRFLHDAGMDADWFRARMKALKITQDDLAAVLHRDRSRISKVLSGEERPFRLNEIEPLALTLEVPVYEILYRLGVWRSGKIPAIHCAFVISELEAARLAEKPAPEHNPISRESVLTEYPAETIFSLRLTDDSMDQIAPEGSAIIVDYGRRDLRDGELGVFRHQGRALFRRYRRDGGQRWLEPASGNPRNTPIFPQAGESIEIVGRVVEIRLDHGDNNKRRRK